MTTTTTTTTITDKQIKALSSEALAAGDYAMVDICNTALAQFVSGEDVAYDDDGNVFATREQAEAARAECARVIADAAARV